jgi:hypothetical protein
MQNRRSVLILAFSRGSILQAQQSTFSVDALSPEVPTPFSEADMILPDGSAVGISRASLGLVAGDEVDAFSDGFDYPLLGWGYDADLDGIADGLEAEGRTGGCTYTPIP